MNFETIHLEFHGAVAVLTLNRPQALNALTIEMGNEMQAAFAKLSEAGARALVLTGAGRAFCAGGDIREMQKIAQEDGRVEAFFDEPLRMLNDCILMFRNAAIPIIAAVNGLAFGAGCNFALACDVVIAAESAKFNQSFVNIGLTPDCGGTFILPRLVGMKRAAYLLMTGDSIDAQQAESIGMINFVVPDEAVLPEAMKLAERLANSPTGALGRIKGLLEASAANNCGAQLEEERKMQMLSAKSLDFREGVSAFLEKRPPRFLGT